MSLQKLRDASETVWAKLLMGILIFSFVGWGAANWILGEASVGGALLRVGGESISAEEFDRERSRQIAQMGKEMQRQIYADKTTQKYFTGQVISNLTTRLLLEQHASNLGLAVSPSRVANIIKGSPEFWENGAFSTDKFDAVLDMNGITEKYFADTLRRQELREMILSSLGAQPATPNFVATAIYNSRNQTRKIEYSAIKFDAFKAAGTPTEDDLRIVYSKNPKLVPEFRTISYVIVGAKMANAESFDRGFESARSIEDMLAAGDSIRDAAKKMRANYRTFDPMTIQKRTTSGAMVGDSLLTEEMMQKLFSMEQGLESEIMEAKNGFVIWRVEKIDPARATPFGERRTELTALWRRGEQEKQAYARANEIVVDGKKLAVSATIGRAAGAPLEVLAAAFQQDPGRAKITAADGVFYVVKVLEEIQPKPSAAKIKEIAAEMRSQVSRQILDDYSGYLSRKYPVRPNERMMRRLFQ
ncbi:MAG: SurA N-terminal domain-containing protein [Rickettsiales bacterium]|jgi:peptidyl-prolyl cis-trans isomerase D|nr:SurA N-terminal domain-containing protein [Rickettsiales bacterium]